MATPPRKRSAATPASSIRPAARRRSTPSCSRCAKAAPVERLETQRLRKDGTLVDVSVTFSPILDVGERDRRRLGDLARHHAAGPRAPGDRRARGADPAAARLDRGSDLRHRPQRRLHLLQRGVRAAARLRLAGGADRQADAPADSPHAGRTARRTRRSSRRSIEAMRHRDGGARRRRGAVARRRHVVPGGVLEPSDRPQRRGDRRGGHLPRHHRAAPGRAGDAGRRAPARAVPRDAVARAAQSARRDPQRDARARQRAAGADDGVPARPARSSRGRPTTCRGCSTICSTWRASRAAGSCCARSRSICATRRARRSRRSARSWPSTTRSSTVDIADEPMPVLGDPARLQQIQANLLSNASKYSPRGGAGALRAQARRRRGA